ncbi:aquaporin [Nonomuraea lactucae]|uniref:aquaporin n=1 Tax=Nonomuraea lactucae TaxID=2249762 RepID=UPI000DE3E385|nr:aquaporin [Nonomuraea lactucae]
MKGLARRALAEFLGTALLLIAVVGSGIAAQRLSPHDVGLQLLQNSTATAAALVAIIVALGPVSGAHLNPVVTLADRIFSGLTSGEAAAYIGAAYWFTSSTSFANPAATLARMLTDSFAVIAPASTSAFLTAELIGAALAVPAIAVLYPRVSERAADVVVPHETTPPPSARQEVTPT